MLVIKAASVQVRDSGEDHFLVNTVSAVYPLGHFGAILGPSGCGKTTLLKMIAGIAPGDEFGELTWMGKNLAEDDFHASEIAYVPQFSIAHEELTARECVEFSLTLRTNLGENCRAENVIERLLAEVGMSEFSDRRVSTLSGGQRRRLALAMELTSKPEILLCDEVTSGLDPEAEREIMGLLKQQAVQGKLVLSVTHSLAHLETYDSITVLSGGYLAYHGSPELLCHYFHVEDAEKLYACLALREPKAWGEQWDDYRESYEVAPNLSRESVCTEEDLGETTLRAIPGFLRQFTCLLRRRILIFSRSTSQILLQIGLIFGFPLIVTIFAWEGLPAVQNLSLGLDMDMIKQMDEAKDFLKHSSKVGGIVSGLVMFQVILLTLMGANNSGREIAAERSIFEKEKLAGLNVGAYVASKVCFLALFVAAQSVWMGLFVHFICQFPGDLGMQIGFLLLVNLAITSLCLGISSLMATAEQASLVSIYLVGFQLPLSGAVLALPENLGYVIRPLISAYWSWSGILETLREERYYDLVKTVSQSPLTPIPICLWVLGTHILVGLVVAWLGSLRRHPI
jgi:ABC-type multidrug transport system ATPase subunit